EIRRGVRWFLVVAHPAREDPRVPSWLPCPAPTRGKGNLPRQPLCRGKQHADLRARLGWKYVSGKTPGRWLDASCAEELPDAGRAAANPVSIRRQAALPRVGVLLGGRVCVGCAEIGRHTLMQDPLLIDVPIRVETARLILRPHRAGDGPALHDALVESIAELRRCLWFIPWIAEEQTPDSAELRCRKSEANFL